LKRLLLAGFVSSSRARHRRRGLRSCGGNAPLLVSQGAGPTSRACALPARPGITKGRAPDLLLLQPALGGGSTGGGGSAGGGSGGRAGGGGGAGGSGGSSGGRNDGRHDRPRPEGDRDRILAADPGAQPEGGLCQTACAENGAGRSFTRPPQLAARGPSDHRVRRRPQAAAPRLRPRCPLACQGSGPSIQPERKNPR
jgi:hypothetical protein